MGENMGVKADGGIRTLSDALKMIQAGANRLGTNVNKRLTGLFHKPKSVLKPDAIPICSYLPEVKWMLRK